MIEGHLMANHFGADRHLRFQRLKLIGVLTQALPWLYISRPCAGIQV